MFRITAIPGSLVLGSLTLAQTPGFVLDELEIGDGLGGFPDILEAQNCFGSAVACLGDVDGDGIDDLGVGDFCIDDGTLTGFAPGGAWVLFLNADGTVKSHQKISNDEGGLTATIPDFARFGDALEALGDLDGDTVPDIAVGAPYQDDGAEVQVGSVWILFLNADGTVKAHQEIRSGEGGFTGTIEAGDFFGSAVANVGDFDGDGVIDLVVGATGDDDGASSAGAGWLLHMNTDGTVKSHQKLSLTEGGGSGWGMGDQFGSGAAGLGDLDGDGTLDVAIGARTKNIGADVWGAIFVLFLESDGTIGSQEIITNGFGGFDQEVYSFGSALTTLADLDGDGIRELVAGTWNATSTSGQEGAFWVLFMNDSGTVKYSVRTIEGQNGFMADIEKDAWMGYSVADMGDLDGDGNADLAVGVPLRGVSSFKTGSLFLTDLNGDDFGSTVTVRNGSGANALCFSSATPPALGSDWIAEVDTTNHPGATFSYLGGRDLPLDPPVVINAGEILIDIFTGNLLFDVTVVSSGGVDSFVNPVPNDLSFLGFPVYAQGAILGGGAEACNAVDLVVGAH